jgi:DNA-binding transcriptional MerR regulator
MRVGQVARLADVGIETVRFYEKSGPFEEPARRGSGYRVYDEATVSRLKFIQRAKNLGFTLAEIKDLLSLRSSSDQPCDGVRGQAEAKIKEIEAKVALLLSMKRVLVKLLASCGERGGGTRCLMLDALYGISNAGEMNDGDLADLPDQRGATSRRSAR